MLIKLSLFTEQPNQLFETVCLDDFSVLQFSLSFLNAIISSSLDLVIGKTYLSAHSWHRILFLLFIEGALLSFSVRFIDSDCLDINVDIFKRHIETRSGM